MNVAEGQIPEFVTKEERDMAFYAHLTPLVNLLTGFGGLIAAGVIYLTWREKSDFVRFHALQSLLFQAVVSVGAAAILLVTWVPGFACSFLTFGIGTFVAVPLMFVAFFVVLAAALGGSAYQIVKAFQMQNSSVDIRLPWVADRAAMWSAAQPPAGPAPVARPPATPAQAPAGEAAVGGVPAAPVVGVQPPAPEATGDGGAALAPDATVVKVSDDEGASADATVVKASEPDDDVSDDEMPEATVVKVPDVDDAPLEATVVQGPADDEPAEATVVTAPDDDADDGPDDPGDATLVDASPVAPDED